jgi:hypothetical protein
LRGAFVRSSEKVTINTNRANAFALLCCVLFVLSGSLWLWRPGVQTDEALFTAGIWNSHPIAFIRIFKVDYPTMVMTYVGALKSFVWRPVFALFGVTPESIRFPAVVIGALSVWCFYRLALHTVGVRSALAGVALLATDTIYLLTVRWDWGPVAIQHLMMVSGLLALVRFHQTSRLIYLFLGFFTFGLALWDKALFAWSLAALGLTGLVVFPREIRSRLRVATVVVATAGVLAGAYPLIRYNVKNNWVTFVSNAARNQEGYGFKARLLLHTLNAEATGSPIIREWWDGPARPLESSGEKAMARFAGWFGSPHTNLHPYLLLGSLLTLPFLWRTPARRAILFSLLWMAATWIQMASVQLGGTSTHHTVLLWPMPILIIAAGLAWASVRIRRGGLLLAIVIGAACVWNLAVTATWYTNLLRYGGVPAWTDAIYPASDALRNTTAEKVCLVEWGFFDTLNSFHQGRLPLCITDDPVTDDSRRYASMQISNPNYVFLTHTPKNRIEPERTDRFLKFAEEQGFRRTDLRTFADSNGRPVVELFRFVNGPSMK